MKNFFSKKSLLGLVFFLILFFIVIFVRIYFFASTDSVSLFFSKVIPISVIKVDEEKIYYKDYIIISRLVDSNIFLKDLIFFKEDKTNCEKIIEQLLYRNFLEKVADKYELDMSREEKQSAYDFFLKQFESKKDAQKYLKDTYNVSLSDYQKIIINNNLLLNKIEKNISTDKEIENQIKEILDLILEKLNNSEDFASLAIKYSQDDLATKGGDLGWFNRGKMVEEVESVLYNLKKDEIYPKAIKTLFGYHFVKLTDFEKGDLYPDGDSKIRASQILIRKANANSIIQTMIKDFKITIKIKKLRSCQTFLN